MKTYAIISLFTALVIGDVSYAQDRQMADKCFPIEGASGRLKAASLKPHRRDTVDSFLDAYFVDVENRSLPMKLYLKHEGMWADFIVRSSGEIEGFHSKVFSAPDDAMICGPVNENGKIGLGMSTSVRFKSVVGEHAMTEILDGVKDGKSHHKKNLGGAKALFVPKMTHVAIVYEASNAAPDVSAIANGKRIPVALEPYGDMWVIDVEALEDSHAETLTIGGGSYELFPVPNIKKMKSLGIN